MEKPKKYAKPKDEADIEPSHERLPLQQWIVYSDRVDNQTFAQPGGKSPFKKLQFLEELYVCAEDGDYVRVVKDPTPNLLQLSSSAVDYGWIAKKNLILWGRSLVTEVGDIPRKAMILNTIRHLKTRSKGNPEIVEFRTTPEQDGKKTGTSSNLFQFFFVLKSEGDWILLSKEELIPQKRVVEVVVGWAPADRVSRWDHRKAVEPNWEPEAVRERQSGQRARVLGDNPTAIAYRNGDQVTPDKILWDEGRYNSRPIGEWRRFPILRTPKNDPGLMVLGTMGSIYMQDGESAITPEKMADLQKSLDDISYFKRNVSIVFVIDGTTSMSPYFSAMTQGIRRAISELSSQNQSKNKFKYGAVIYRDYAEGAQRLAEVLPLRSDQNQILSFLDPRKAGDNRDADTPEALYYGLREGLRKTGLNQKETNILILVGDAGNHARSDPSQIDRNEIISSLLHYDCHFLSFQVHHGDDASYQEFVDQTQWIVERTAEEKHGRITSQYGPTLLPEPTAHRQGNRYELNGGAFVGAVYGLNQGDPPLEPAKLTAAVAEAMVRLDELTDHWVKTLQDMITGTGFPKPSQSQESGGSVYSSAFAPGIYNHLVRAGLTKEDLAILSKDKYQLYVEAPATVKVKSQKYPLFKQVLLLSKQDLYTMINILERLSASVDERKDLSEAWKQILKTYVGNVDEKELEKKTMQELNEMIFGLPGTNEFLSRVRIGDITDPAAFPQLEVRKYVERVRERARELRRVADMPETEYKYGFRSNEVPYLWIEEDLIP